MTKIDIGECCLECREVIDGEVTEPNAATRHSVESIRRVEKAEGGTLHTGEDAGFSWHPCDVCGEDRGGTRWEVFALV